MVKFISTTLILFFCVLAGAAEAQQPAKQKAAGRISSIYTDLSSKKCKTIKTETEPAGSVQSCSGVSGYKLLVEDSDARMSITVVTPKGVKYPLDYWEVVTTAFSSVGNKAEWRVTRQGGKVSPIALIVRVNANESTDSNKVTPYLAVAKVTPEKICVTDKIKVDKTANEKARAAADSSAAKACMNKQ